MKTSSRTHRDVVSWTATALIGAVLCSDAHAQRYRVVDLGLLSPDHSGFLPGPSIIPTLDPGTFAINDEGQVAYAIWDPEADQLHAAIWLPEDDYGLAGETIHDLTTVFGANPPASPSIARGINGMGQVVGQAGGLYLGVAGSRALLWDFSVSPQPTSTIIPPLGSAGWSRALAITEPEVDTPASIVCESESGDLCREFCELGFEDPVVALPEGYFVNVTSTGVSLPRGFGTSNCNPTALPRSAALVRDGIEKFELVVAGLSAEPEGGPCLPSVGPECDAWHVGSGWTSEPEIPQGQLLAPVAAEVLDDFDDPFELVFWGSEGRAVNRNRVLVGFGEETHPECLIRALLWNGPGAEKVDLHALAGLQADASSRADGLNDEIPPRVVGANLTIDRAALWEVNNGNWNYVNLNEEIARPPVGHQNDPEVQVRRAHDINNGGIDDDPEPWIIGWGVEAGEPGNPRHTYLLVPLEECLGDVDGNGDVGFGDLGLLLINWGSCEGRICREDLDFDLVVGFADLTLILTLWGPCSQELQSTGLPGGLVSAWLDVGGADAIESGGVTAAEIAQCMEQSSPTARFSGLMGLLSQESQE